MRLCSLLCRGYSSDVRLWCAKIKDPTSFSDLGDRKRALLQKGQVRAVFRLKTIIASFVLALNCRKTMYRSGMRNWLYNDYDSIVHFQACLNFSQSLHEKKRYFLTRRSCICCISKWTT